jgi:hypothetical protein
MSGALPPSIPGYKTAFTKKQIEFRGYLIPFYSEFFIFPSATRKVED